MNVSEWILNDTQELKQARIDSARLDALLLIRHMLDTSLEWVLAHGDEILSDDVTVNLNKKLAQRINHTPLAYIIGSKDFYGHSFIVNESVLIPRPESEVMIEMLVGLVNNTEDLVKNKQLDPLIRFDRLTVNKSEDDKPAARYAAGFEFPTIFDVGTGSGCLAISAALLLPGADVSASDTSEAALAVAHRNAKAHNVHVRFHKSDLLADMPRMPANRPYVILANLPYVPEGLITSPEITKEPAEALFSGRDGLDHYKRLWNQIAQLKNKPFVVITESLENQHEEMERMAGGAGYGVAKLAGLVQVFVL